MFQAMIDVLKANPRKIVFTEGHDARILEATARLVEGGFLTPILIGNVEEVKANAAKGGFNIEGVEILDPATYEGMGAMVEKMVELRKGKMSAEDCHGHKCPRNDVEVFSFSPFSWNFILQNSCVMKKAIV